MALSDVCSDTLNSLAEDLVNYSDWDYSPSQITYVIDAMYSLASLGIQLDTPPNFVNPKAELALHNIVIGAVLDTEDDEKPSLSTSKLKMLADLSKVHSRTASGLDAIYNEVTENPTSYILKFNPILITQLNEIKKYQQLAS